jgi:hypothetical protein
MSTPATIGAGLGAIGGSVVPGIGTAIGSAAGGLLGAGLGSLFASAPKETPIQKTQRELIDQLLASVKGKGPYSDLFNMDEAAFKKSYVDPSLSRFRNQIAPQIEQQYISSGQQRGTGLEDTLTRAGVDLNSILDQHYAEMKQGAMNRQASALSGILGQGAGVQQPYSTGENLMAGLGGYLSSPEFGKNIGSIGQSLFQDKTNDNQPPKTEPLSKGYTT